MNDIAPATIQTQASIASLPRVHAPFRGAGVLVGMAFGSLCAVVGLVATLHQLGW